MMITPLLFWTLSSCPQLQFSYFDVRTNADVSVAQEGTRVVAIRNSRRLPRVSSPFEGNEGNWTLATGTRYGDSKLVMETGFQRIGKVDDNCDIQWLSPHAENATVDKWVCNSDQLLSIKDYSYEVQDEVDSSYNDEMLKSTDFKEQMLRLLDRLYTIFL